MLLIKIQIYLRLMWNFYIMEKITLRYNWENNNECVYKKD